MPGTKLEERWQIVANGIPTKTHLTVTFGLQKSTDYTKVELCLKSINHRHVEGALLDRQPDLQLCPLIYN